MAYLAIDLIYGTYIDRTLRSFRTEPSANARTAHPVPFYKQPITCVVIDQLVSLSASWTFAGNFYV